MSRVEEGRWKDAEEGEGRGCWQGKGGCRWDDRGTISNGNPKREEERYSLKGQGRKEKSSLQQGPRISGIAKIMVELRMGRGDEGVRSECRIGDDGGRK
ncbi:hypothetical protein CC1G_15582 [Coprinopsis cinerea okayama7|uniref:Uncharacterized protein n=1 Tax=Coprinopsis cinerea (strain Okayama-7 / 130 / ATCC MYA-4618 / FGSC 9003) TaxID=240176 RepID=D6RN69_COPC7|nr:hypothetical protein CC1G_15582 [Coprinopsis cinerea okayama7\|eukprot:XP_002911039.1 hypothetical protein CC1G_15582 [Coprinopsis cinerea okayama7\